ncbi:MAG TPA: exo-alpha-sialidase [Planctomycetaceae bacterium]|nr:exo-alpha-sialidase [Planctomycetaceae bacterium]
MFTRRLLCIFASLFVPSTIVAADPTSVGYQVQLDVIHRGYDGRTCWVHPRAGAIPGQPPAVVLTMQQLLLTGSDVFFALNEMRTDDLGQTWTGPTEHRTTLGRREEAGGMIVATCDFTPKWHARSHKLLGIGQTVRYRDDRVIPERDRETSYAVYDTAQRTWTSWATLEMPDRLKFQSAGAGSVQRLDLPDGDILLPIYFKNREQSTYRTTVLRCAFDGITLRYREHGSEMTVAEGRGLYEPSLTWFQGRYYLTLRNDSAGYVAVGTDGLHFDPPHKWLWDDGSDLGNYNTQQHWVTHSDGLFLVYTRRGANNDHVFRHRAPLFIAQVDPDTRRILRRTERVLVPERGARLGNFGVTQVNERETWVTVAEWMQTWGPNIVIPPDNQYHADNSVYVAQIRWEQPNRLWDKY